VDPRGFEPLTSWLPANATSVYRVLFNTNEAGRVHALTSADSDLIAESIAESECLRERRSIDGRRRMPPLGARSTSAARSSRYSRTGSPRTCRERRGPPDHLADRILDTATIVDVVRHHWGAAPRRRKPGPVGTDPFDSFTIRAPTSGGTPNSRSASARFRSSDLDRAWQAADVGQRLATEIVASGGNAT